MTLEQPISDWVAARIAERLHVLGQPMRVRLIDRLAAETTTVQELVDALGTTQQNISQHLGIMRRAGIVARHKEGTHVHYQLDDTNILAILELAQASSLRRGRS
jgi:DNA-binding transcriptional ArsR family regulator